MNPGPAGESPAADFTQRTMPLKSVAERTHVHEAKDPAENRRRRDAEAVLSCLRVSASQRENLLQPMSRSGRCHTNEPRSVSRPMKLSRPQRRRNAEAVPHVSASPRLRVSASPGAIPSPSRAGATAGSRAGCPSFEWDAIWIATGERRGTIPGARDRRSSLRWSDRRNPCSSD